MIEHPSLPGVKVAEYGGLRWCPGCQNIRHSNNGLYPIGEFCYIVSSYCSTCHLFVGSTLYNAQTGEVVNDPGTS